MVEENYQIYNRLEIVNIELDNVTETKLEDETNYEKVDKEKEASIVYTVKSNDSNPVYMFLKSQLYEDKVTNYNQVIVKVEGQNEFPQFDSSAYNIEYIGNYQAGEEIKIKVEIKEILVMLRMHCFILVIWIILQKYIIIIKKYNSEY